MKVFRAIWAKLRTIRGQLVLLYLSVLAILLLILGVFQSITLTQYLRTTTAAGLRQSSYAELRVLGECFVGSPAALFDNAQTLARLLGSPETAVKILTPTGETLADHDFGSPGASHPLRLSATTIRQLIALTSTAPKQTPPIPHLPCQKYIRSPYFDPLLPRASHSVVNQGNLVLVAIPLGPYQYPLGYAILGRSFAFAGATVRRSEVVFFSGAVIALVLAALVALPLINRALRPLRRVSDTAVAIATGHLEQRANLAQSTDEVGMLGSAFDTMVDRLQSALVSANESEARMRRFLADASHELRTPLTVVRGMSEVLLRQGATERPDHFAALKDLHEEAVRMSMLVDDLLTLTRLDHGQPPGMEGVELRGFLEEFIARYASAWPSRRIDIEVTDLDGSMAQASPEALRRVLTNLIDNAARYSRSGDPIVIRASGGESVVTLAVCDSGPGLAPEDARQAFDRFFRGTRSRSRGSGGSGLGLAIVQALVTQSGGQVSMETGPDRGTDVIISLRRHVTDPTSA